MKNAFLPSVVAAALIAAASLPASAAVTLYDDRAAFEAAVAGPLTNENFNSIDTDQSFQTADGPKSVGPLTFTETGPSTAGSVNGTPNQIDADPFQSSGVFSGNKSTYVYLAANADDSPSNVYGVNLTFSGPVTAFGADFTEFIGTTPSEVLRLTLLSSTTPASFLLPTPLSSDTFFFGIIADSGDSFGGLDFSADAVLPSRRAVGGLDNVSIALIEGPSIPEPASALFTGLGLAATLIFRRNRSTSR